MSKYSYDNQIAYLKENPDKIIEHWNEAKGIFKIIGASMDEKGKTIGVSHDGGCLTMVKIGADVVINGSVNIELTQKIRDDSRVPCSPSRTTTSDLEVFKEYQEYADSLIN